MAYVLNSDDEATIIIGSDSNIISFKTAIGNSRIRLGAPGGQNVFQAPLIDLDGDDGSAVFAGTVLAAGLRSQTTVAEGTTLNVIRSSSSATDTLATFKSDVGGANSTVLSIKCDGSAEFAGVLTVDRAQGANTAFSVTLQGSPTVGILADGTATFAGAVTATNITAISSALTAVKAAANDSATDLAGLKAALLSALSAF